MAVAWAPLTGAETSTPSVLLRRLSSAESEAFIAGDGRPAKGLRWDPDYPTEDTFVALGLLRLAHDARSTSPEGWWLYQIVVTAAGDDVVVGDIGFHGPPEPGRRAVVEIGYSVVPDWRGLGVATRACALILEQAWRDGADLVQAEAVNSSSRAVLRKCGFRLRDGNWFEASKP
jgi:RimJ/RimL family protein N-acetyltransferase